jgi:mono/diheme cytochrome c family protein
MIPRRMNRRWLWVAAGLLLVAGLGLYAKSVIEESSVPPGPPEVAGRILMERKRCVRCHKIEGVGGLVGPDLTVVALRKDQAWMLKYLEDPRAINPKAKMPKPRLTPEQRAAIVAYLRTLDGR